MHPGYYRVRILADAARTLLLPQVLLLAVLRLTHSTPGTFLKVLLHVASVPVVGVLRSWYKSYANHKAAGALSFVYLWRDVT